MLELFTNSRNKEGQLCHWLTFLLYSAFFTLDDSAFAGLATRTRINHTGYRTNESRDRHSKLFSMHHRVKDGNSDHYSFTSVVDFHFFAFTFHWKLKQGRKERRWEKILALHDLIVKKQKCKIVNDSPFPLYPAILPGTILTLRVLQNGPRSITRAKVQTKQGTDT